MRFRKRPPNLVICLGVVSSGVTTQRKSHGFHKQPTFFFIQILKLKKVTTEEVYIIRGGDEFVVFIEQNVYNYVINVRFALLDLANM